MDPYFALEGLKRVPTVKLQQQPNYFYDNFMGFKVDKPVMNDPAVRRAINLAVNKEAINKAVWFNAGEVASSYVNPNAQDASGEAAAKVPGFDPAAARKVLDEAGWTMGSDGVRVKDGQRATFLAYAIQHAYNNGMMQAIQADLRRIGIEMRVQLWDATVAWGKLATQEFDAFIMSYPYASATDALGLYFPSASRPTPNRMNWNDAETDRLINAARAATAPEDRAKAIGEAQVLLSEQNPWLPLIRQPLWLMSGQRVEGRGPMASMARRSTRASTSG
ncbi:ABC transporter substrate-binding protein [Pseudoroseomonas wenyumeiae]